MRVQLSTRSISSKTPKMSDKTIKEIIETLVPKSEFETEENKLKLIYKLLRQRHELQQVSLEVYRILSKTDKTSLEVCHCESELERVLFESDVFLYCERDLPKNLGEEE